MPLEQLLAVDQENLRHKYQVLINQARHNHRILRKFQSFELRLMGCSSMTELIRVLLTESRHHFGWDVVTLFLHDPDYELKRLIDHHHNADSDLTGLILSPEIAPIETLYNRSRVPILMPFLETNHAILFPTQTMHPASVALLPLWHGAALVGCLNLGSCERTRFTPEAGSDFLNHLAAVVSVCIETATVRENLRVLGLIDSLTGVNNRRFFDQRLLEEVERSRRTGLPMSCIFVDLDHFKQVNDTHGHQVGDQVLQQAATLIRNQLRSMDVVARYGGEEFVVLLGQAECRRAMEIAERIRQSIAVWEFHTQGVLNVTASLGVATLENHSGQSAEIVASKLIQQADAALYSAKRGGRDRVVQA